jgi:5-methylcytosine-specific restriction endonuclease McrA
MINKMKTIKRVIPKALREQVWLKFVGKRYETKCYIRWCKNKMDVFNFHVGHNIPESQGGPTTLENLRPICARCNLSMGDSYTIDEWQLLGKVSCFNWSGWRWC